MLLLIPLGLSISQCKMGILPPHFTPNNSVLFFFLTRSSDQISLQLTYLNPAINQPNNPTLNLLEEVMKGFPRVPM
jgi:hypothetical protein